MMAMVVIMMIVVVMTMIVSRWFLFVWLTNINYIKVGHHAGSMMLQDVAMIHPCSRSVVWDPRNLDLCSWF